MAAAGNFEHVSAAEHALMNRLHATMGVGKIAAQLERSKDTVSKHVSKKPVPTGKKPKGRPLTSIRTPQGFARMEKVYQRLLRASKGCHEVGGS